MRKPGAVAGAGCVQQSQPVSRNRLEIARAMAKRFNVEVPAEVERFYAASKPGSGRNPSSFDSLNKQRMGPDRSEALTTLWGQFSKPSAWRTRPIPGRPRSFSITQ